MADSDVPRDQQVQGIVAEGYRGEKAGDLQIIQGLIYELPRVGSYFSAKERALWHELADAIFVTLYGKAEGNNGSG